MSRYVPISGAKAPITDPYYRYQMPVMITQQGGGSRSHRKGGKATTVIVNCQQIAKSLHRDVNELVKFFGIELCTSSSLDRQNGQVSIRGNHSVDCLRRILATYIDMCVLCSKCHLPETTYVTGTSSSSSSKKVQVHAQCNACGHTCSVSEEDWNHPIGRYVQTSIARTTVTTTKKVTNSNKKNRDNNLKKKNTMSTIDKESIVPSSLPTWSSSLCSPLSSPKVVAQESEEIEEKRNNTEAHRSDDGSLSSSSGSDNVAWEAGTDDATALDVSVKLYRKFLKHVWVPGDVDGAIHELINRQVSALLPSTYQIHILLRAVLRSKYCKTWKKDTKLLVPILQQLLSSSSSSSSVLSLEREIMAALETVCRNKPKYFPVLVLLLYNDDVVSEETILSWSQDVSNNIRVYPRDTVNDTKRKQLRKESQPLIDWLEQSDDDDDEEDSDDDSDVE